MAKDKTHWLAMGPIQMYVGYSPSEAAYLRAMKRMGVVNPPVFVPEGKGACVHHLVNDRGVATSIVCFDKENHKGVAKNALIALLAQEAVHVMQECREVMGGDYHGREFEAYTTQWVFQFLLDKAFGEE